MKKAQLNFGITLMALFTVLFYSCDIVEQPVYVDDVPVVEYGFCDTTEMSPAFNDTVKSDPASGYKILLEDYTGHTCGNCPEAGILADSLNSKYDPQIIAMAVHAGFFAKTSNDYPMDFKTDEGETYFDHFTVVTNPNGMINRTDYTGKKVLGITQWDQAVQAIKDNEQTAQINIQSVFNSDRRILYVDADVEFLKASTGRYKLVAHLLEDQIISDQKDYSKTEEHVTDFEHRHVLRATIENSAWGKEVNTADVAEGETFNMSFDKFCVDQDWDEAHCSVVVYIYDIATEEIIQVQDVYITTH